MAAKLGDRVIAVLYTHKGVVHSLGEGEYLGEDTPEAMQSLGFPNPTIKLDNGEVVFGVECWWGPVEAVRKKFAGMEWREVPVEIYRPKKKPLLDW